jgi:hypothetical protein
MVSTVRIFRISREMWNTYMLVTVLLQYLVPLVVISITYGLIAKVRHPGIG